MPPTLTPERFTEILDRAVITGDCDCWTWPGAHNRSNRSTLRRYGQVRIQGRQYYIHRIAYEVMNGELAEGMEIDHTCVNSLCYNPDHLEAVTKPENIKRRHARRRKVERF